MYRLGIVYIMNDDSLTPVFNLRVCAFTAAEESNYVYMNGSTPIRQTLLKPRNCFLDTSNSMSNTMGVFKLPNINIISGTNIKPLYFEMKFPDAVPVKNGTGSNSEYNLNVSEELKKLGVKGYFFVRQERIQSTIAQGVSIGVDRESAIPLIYLF